MKMKRKIKSNKKSKVKNKITDRPINSPPVSADTGVKFTMFI